MPNQPNDDRSSKVDKSGPRVRRMFGEIAGKYDRLNHLLSLNIDKYWRRQTVRLAPAANGARVLDVCTGTGDLALAYGRSVDGEVSVVAADFCHEMLEIGRRKSIEAGLAKDIAFLEADAQRLPLPDDAFDLVCVAFGLRNVFDTDAGLCEMSRVCVPGGVVAVLEFSMPDSRLLKVAYQSYFKHVLPKIGQLLARNQQSAYEYLPSSVGEFPQGDALAGRMRAAGLTDVWHRPLTFGVATLYVGAKGSPSVSEDEPPGGSRPTVRDAPTASPAAGTRL
ncbi:MAG: bifunctional demethylmenaquinone methyltransferase/2-methoxy-6-polyprenyl-1,4-benzoquinol methylase UbiE [Planctomycetota bacterium]